MTPPPAELGVLDVVEPGWHVGPTDRSGGSDAALVALAAASPRAGAWVVGTSEAAHGARALGVRVAGVTRPHAGWRGALGDGRRPGHPAAQHTVRLWGTGATATAQRGCRLELRAFGPPDPAQARLARTARSVEVFTEHDRLAWARIGVAARRVPLPDFAPLASRCAQEGATLRARLDLGEDRLIVPVAERAAQIDGRQFGFLMALLAVTERPVAGMLPQGARHFGLGRRHLHGLMGPCRLLESRLSPLVVLAAADLALLPPAVGEGTGAEAAILAWAAALGVPAVRWGQRAPGKLRHTPGLAWPVFEALDELAAAKAIAHGVTAEAAGA